MTKKKKKSLESALSCILVFIGLLVIFKFELSWYFLIGLLIFVPVLSFLIVNLIPNNQNKNTSTSPKKSKQTKDTSPYSNKRLSDKDLLSANIDTLSGTDFERLCYLYFEDNGFKPESTRVSGDHGVDLVINDPNDGMKIAVQCKRWKDKAVGNNDLIKLYGGKRAYKCMGTLFITTSSYTKAAKDYSESVGMIIWNGLIVQDKIGKWQKEKLKKIG
jgi:restriction system protein